MTVVPFPIPPRMTHEGQTQAVRSFNAWLQGQGIPFFVWRRPALKRYDVLEIRAGQMFQSGESFRTLRQAYRHFAGETHAKLIEQRIWPLIPDKEKP